MPKQERFNITPENMMRRTVREELDNARLKIRSAQKREMGCSETCIHGGPAHSEDCPNRNRYDVI